MHPGERTMVFSLSPKYSLVELLGHSSCFSPFTRLAEKCSVLEREKRALGQPMVSCGGPFGVILTCVFLTELSLSANDKRCSHVFI